MLKPSDWLLEPHGCPGFLKHHEVARIQKGPTTHHTEYLSLKIPSRYALVNLTEQVEESIERSEIQDGLCFISAMHITSGLYVNDAESGLLADLSLWLESLAPFGKNYAHHQTGEDNGDAHLKSYLTGHALTAPITDWKLDFGTWQRIFYAEFDGLREKRVLVKCIGLSSD